MFLNLNSVYAPYEYYYHKVKCSISALLIVHTHYELLIIQHTKKCYRGEIKWVKEKQIILFQE